MKDRKEHEHDTMHQSDFISDPFFDLLKEQLDESFELENISVSEDLIQSTLKAIELDKEMKLHKDDSVSALEGKEPISIEDRRLEKIEDDQKIEETKKLQTIETDRIEVEKITTEKAEKIKKIETHRRKGFRYIGVWGSVVAASILLVYFASQDIFSRVTSDKMAATSGVDQSSESAMPESIENSDGEFLDKKQETADSGSGLESNAKEPSVTLRNDSALVSQESGSEESKLEEKESYSITADKNSDVSEEESMENEEYTMDDQTLSSQQDKPESNKADSLNGITAQGNGKVAKSRAMEDALSEINARASKETIMVTLDANAEEKSKEIMLLMASEELHLILEEPSKELKYIICIQISEENVIVYFINESEVMIQSYGTEGLVTSTSYEVAKSYQLISKIEDIIE